MVMGRRCCLISASWTVTGREWTPAGLPGILAGAVFLSQGQHVGVNHRGEGFRGQAVRLEELGARIAGVSPDQHRATENSPPPGWESPFPPERS